MPTHSDGSMASQDEGNSMTATRIALPPLEGPAYDKTKPETRQPWLDFRSGGITATEIRDWGTASKRRQIIDSKVSGVWEDLSHLPYVNHGNRREAPISDWIFRNFGITPCESVFAHPEYPRHLASPDGITRDPFTGKLVYGTADAVLAEIKTSKYDLLPGILDEHRVLVDIAEGSKFDSSGYYTQMQWQMYVMDSPMTLFVWEQHDNKIDPETGTFSPVGMPQFAWIPRNQGLIDILLEKVAPKALAEIDAARTALRGADLPPASDFPAEDAVLVQDVVAARTAAATAELSRVRAWNALGEKYLGDATEDNGHPDCSHDLGFATLTISTSTSAAKVTEVTETDWDAVRAGFTEAQRKKYDTLIAKHTKTVDRITPGKTTRRMTITEKKA